LSGPRSAGATDTPPAERLDDGERRQRAADGAPGDGAQAPGVAMTKEQDRDFQHESLQDRESILAYLNALAEGFSSGSITFSDKDGEINLSPAGLVNLEVRANRKRDRVSLTVKLSWKDAAEDHGPAKLMIRTDNGSGNG
jgi:amphi-Trp domain-containing protein